MELDEMKAAWAALERKLDENNRMSAAMMRRMIEHDSRRAKGQIVINEWAGILVTIALLPLLIWRVGQMLHSHNQVTHIFVWIACGIAAFALITSIVKLRLLSKIDSVHNVAGNISAINRFNIYIRWEKLVGRLVQIFLVTIVVLMWWSVRAKLETWNWGVLVAGILISPVLFWLQYGKIYRSNIEAISRSLADLKEIEELQEEK